MTSNVEKNNNISVSERALVSVMTITVSVVTAYIIAVVTMNVGFIGESGAYGLVAVISAFIPTVFFMFSIDDTGVIKI